MKDIFSYIGKKLLQYIILTGLKKLVGVIILALASASIVKEVLDAGKTQIVIAKWMLVLPYIIILLIIVFIVVFTILRFGTRTSISWDYIFGLNQHTLCYIDKHHIEYTKTINIYPLVKCVNQISCQYYWTGDKINSVSLNPNNADLSLDTDEYGDYINYGTLEIKHNDCFKMFNKYEYDVSFDLDNSSEKMIRKLVLTVKRPTIKSQLRIVSYPSVKLKNVTARIYNIYGDKLEPLKTIPLYPDKKKSNHINTETYYELRVKHPKLFRRYEIEWTIE